MHAILPSGGARRRISIKAEVQVLVAGKNEFPRRPLPIASPMVLSYAAIILMIRSFVNRIVWPPREGGPHRFGVAGSRKTA
jgi:hypothetical protein